MEQTVLNLMMNYLSSSVTVVNDSVQKLNEIILDPSSFNIFIKLLQNNDSFIRLFSMILIKQNLYQIAKKYQTELIDATIYLIQNDPVKEVRYISCEIIASLSKHETLLNLNQIIDSFLLYPQLIPYAFLILQESYCFLSNPKKYDEILICHFQQIIRSEELHSKKIVTAFFLNFIFECESPELFDSEVLFKNIYESLVVSIQHNENEIVDNFSKIICNFLDSDFPFIENFCSNFISLAFSVVNDMSVPIDIRISLHQIFENVKFIPIEKINDITSSSLKMSCEIFSFESDNDKYQFNSIYFLNLFENFRNNFDLFQHIFSLVQNLLSENQVMISVYLLGMVIEGFEQFLYFVQNELIQMLQFYMKEEFDLKTNEFFIENLSLLLVAISEVNPNIVKPLYSEITNFFISLRPFQNTIVFASFASFLKNMRMLPPNLGDILAFCFESLRFQDEQVREMAFECLRFSIRFYRPDTEGEFCYFQMKNLVSNERELPLYFDLVCALIEVFPFSIKMNFDSIFQMIARSIDTFPIEVKHSSCKLLHKLIQYFPISMSGHLEFIQQVIRSFEIIQINDYLNFESKKQFLLLIATTYKFYDVNKDLIFRHLKEEMNSCCDVLINSIFSIIIEKVDDNFLKTYDFDSSMKTKFILTKGVGNSQDIIFNYVISMFSNNVFDQNVFILIDAFLRLEKNLPIEIVETIQAKASEDNSVSKGHALVSLSYYSCFTNNKEECLKLIQTILNNFDVFDINLKVLLLRAGNIITIYNRNEIFLPPAFLESINNLLFNPSITREMKNEIILTLLHHLKIEKESVNHAKKLFSELFFESFSLESFLKFPELINEISVLISRFYQSESGLFKDEMLNISLLLISSDFLIWNSISSNAREMIKVFISQFSQEQLFKIFRFNEQKMQFFNKNMNSYFYLLN